MLNNSYHILDFEAYDIIQSLRAGPIEAEQLKINIDLPDGKLRKQLNKLEKANIIMRINDEESRQHIMLKCDPEVSTVYS
ncbi:MAG: hypothetical protein ACTSSE_16925 [Candidatus Thorarchaeota archaeon]